MSKGQKLRALVNERLTAAAAEIFELFERTIAEYELEVLRLKQTKKKRKNLQLLDAVLLPRAEPLTTDVQIVSVSEEEVGPSLEASRIKEEPELCIKQEEEQQQEVSFFTPVCVKTEDDEDKSSVLHQRPTEENREETNGEDCGAEAGCSSDPLTQLHSDSEEHTTDHSEDWTQDLTACKQSYMTLNPGSSVSDVGGKTKRHRCIDCGKRFQRKQHLQGHRLIHTGEKPFKCSVCQRDFRRVYQLQSHMRTHTGQWPFHCSICNKGCGTKRNLIIHMRVHTGERPFSCTDCEKSFRQEMHLRAHMKIHSEGVLSCPECHTRFRNQANLNIHLRAHREGKLSETLWVQANS